MKSLFVFLLVATSLSSFANDDKDSAKMYLQKALVEKQHPHIAFQLLQKALLFDKDNVDVMTEYVNVTMEMRKYEMAQSTLDQLYKLDEKNIQTIDNLAHVYFYLRNFDKAIIFGKKMIENGVGTDADFIVGKSEYENENYYDAVRFLESYFKRVTDRSEIPYTIGRCYLELNQNKKAVDYYQKSMAIDSTNAYRIYEMALIYYTLYDERSAIKYFELAAARGYKKDNDYYENMGNAYMNLGQTDKAIENYNVVLQRKPNDVGLLYAIADGYYHVGRYDEAIEYWNKILANDSKNANALYMIGMSYQKKGQKDKGQQICDAAIAIDPALANNKHQMQLNPGL